LQKLQNVYPKKRVPHTIVNIENVSVRGAASERMAEVWDQLDLGPNAHAFFKRVYSSGLGKYTRRLAALGFPGGRRALDAGCGLGQWSFALAAMSSEVYGVDISQERIDACNKISQLLRVKNTRFLSSTLEHLPFENAYFDRLICYSALYLTNYEESIKEFARVIAPGGLLYLSTNGVGRYL
jgi:ubiquinone/menaquinone biosynthesis C-methylase UbiE